MTQIRRNKLATDVKDNPILLVPLFKIPNIPLKNVLLKAANK